MFVNARLIFDTADTNTPVSFDEITGEPIFANSISVVELSIEDTLKWSDILLAGTDETLNYLVGRCINPKQLTQAQRRQRKARIELDVGDVNETTKDVIAGQIELTPAIQSRFGLESYFGERIEGEISFNNLEPLTPTIEDLDSDLMNFIITRTI